jgi:hypothetical protein
MNATNITLEGEEEVNEQWHLDKKVPLSLIFAMIFQGAMVIWAIADIKKDVELLKAQTLVQHERDERQDKNAAEAYALLRQQLEKMDAKLDRLFERRK